MPMNCIKVKDIPTDNNTNMIYDECYKSVQNQQSSAPGEYRMSGFHSCKCEVPTVRKISIERPAHSAKQYKDGYGWTSIDGCNIDKDSNLRNAKNLTNLRFINQLYERPYLTVPYMGRGIGNKKLETVLVPGEDTYQAKPCNNLSGLDTTHFNMYPLLPNIKDNIQNKKHLIEEENGWVRSGAPSRQIIRNKNYLEKCGYVFDGKNWMKSNQVKNKCM